MELHKRCALWQYFLANHIDAPFMSSISCLSEQFFKTSTTAISDPSAKPNTDPTRNMIG